MDDFFRYTWIYLFKNCSKLYQIYHDFTKMIETQFSKAIKVFRSDNAQEYKAHEFTSILHQFGTVPHSSCAGLLSKMAGLSANFVIFLMLFTLYYYRFYSFSILGGSYSYCRLHHQSVSFSHCSESTSYDMLFGSSSSYDLLRVFECVCFILL